jgi:hypothetical protein
MPAAAPLSPDAGLAARPNPIRHLHRRGLKRAREERGLIVTASHVAVAERLQLATRVASHPARMGSCERVPRRCPMARGRCGRPARQHREAVGGVGRLGREGSAWSFGRRADPARRILRAACQPVAVIGHPLGGDRRSPSSRPTTRSGIGQPATPLRAVPSGSSGRRGGLCLGDGLRMPVAPSAHGSARSVRANSTPSVRSAQWSRIAARFSAM